MDAENIYLAARRVFKHTRFRKRYSTEAAAVDRALEAARQWIDEGKPELFLEKCDSGTISQ